MGWHTTRTIATDEAHAQCCKLLRAPLRKRARLLDDAAKCTRAFLQNAWRQRSRWDRHELNTSTPWSCKNGRNGSECGGSAETARTARSVGTHCAENSRAILQDPNAARHDAFGDQLGREEICVRGAEHKRCLLRLCPS
jgi:hypothetical protein